MNAPTGNGRCTRPTFALLIAALCAAMPSGCKMFERPGAAQPALNWFAHLGEGAATATPPLDLNSIRPTPHTAQVQSGDLLEITVSNLFQPEEWHTFPARVHPDGSIEVPLLGQPVVEGLTRAEIETGLISEFERRELLIAPTVIVRDLETPKVKVFVEGAVERPGVVPLPREDASVYAALISAGIKSNAGSYISVARPLGKLDTPMQQETAALFDVPSLEVEDHPTEQQMADSPTQLDSGDAPTATPHPSGATADIIGHQQPISTPELAETPGSGEMHQQKTAVEYEMILFNTQREDDRQALRELRLGEGDIVNISKLVPPIKVSGEVVNPGTYNIPNSNDVNVLDALNLAGGVTEGEETLTVTLIRMSDSAWPGPGRKWSWTLTDLQSESAHVPAVRPGDVIHLERPAGSKLKQTVGGWLSK